MGLRVSIEKAKRKCECLLGKWYSRPLDADDGSQAFRDEIRKVGLNTPHNIKKGEWVLKVRGYQTQGQICMKCVKLIAETHAVSTEDAALEGLGALFG